MGGEDADHREALRQQRALARFGELALRSESLDEILNEACRLVGEALGTDLAKVVELRPDGETLLVRAGVGWKPGVVGEVRLSLSEGTSEAFALTQQVPVITPDLEAETRFRCPDFLREHGVHAFANVIILGATGRPPFGILQVDSKVRRDFGAADIAFLRSYANLLAAAVERLRVLGELRDSNRDLEQRVAERSLALEAEAAEREQAQAALRQLEAMKTVLSHLPIGAALVAPDGRVLVANPEFRRLLPRPMIPSVDSEVGSEWTAYYPDGQRVAPADYPAARALRGEALLNLDFLHTGAPEGARWRRVSGIPVLGPMGEVAAALVVIVDVDQEVRAAERQTLLTREVDHRAKNMLAVVHAALRLTRAEDTPSFIRAIEGRVAALARAQVLLAADRWSGADLHSLLRGELAPFLNRAGAGPQAALHGPRLSLPAPATQPLSMAIHELATNATKYGALSAPEGLVTVDWAVEGEQLRLRWTERGGPAAAAPPERRGFGSRVLNATIRTQLGGSLTMTWEATGLVCKIAFPLRGTAAEIEAEQDWEGKEG
ncbi:GAF domain-containing protein [Belnapia sp. T6]|uniref:histidine kinase n=1 Tax=Belnapia mucosa TaxID=2804532 RepID=A0ABS1V1B0_9PROT|nr:HWE histidine kinase domain-containing protein [Belnapia mucosa]MBL6454881.1 GAF domain-containing protein [Belnapia mucosa]